MSSNVIAFPEKKLVGPKGYPLRAVILECPYDTLLHDPLARELFPQLLKFKINGYQKEYPYGVLPLETADFVANHVTLCEETPEGYIPHMAFKSITLDRCKTHHLEFPIYHMIHEAKSKNDQEKYERVAEKALHQAEEAHQQIAYNGSWTVSPELRAMKDKINFWEITMMLITQYYTYYGIQQVIAAASARFKVDLGKVTMGFDYFRMEEEKLDPIVVSSYNDEVAYIMHLKEFSAHMKVLCDRPAYRSIWENAIIIGNENQQQKKAA